MLVHNHIVPHLSFAATHARNDFRRERLYNEATDNLLKRNKAVSENTHSDSPQAASSCSNLALRVRCSSTCSTSAVA